MSLQKNQIKKGGAFLIEETRPDDVFTPEDFSEEQLMMKSTLQDFIDREVWPHKHRFENKDYEFTKSLMKQAGEMGFLGVAVPEQYGGLGMDFVSTMLVCDYISGASGSLSTAFGAHTGIGTLPITLYGTEEQKAKYVPKLASGEWFGAYCLTEPGAGSDANSGKTKAVLSEAGDHYRISGQKMWISNAGFANLFVVFARIEDDKNITGFIVPNDPENGITLGDEEKKLGIHASSTRQVFFNETQVPVENMLGVRGGGFKIAMNALNVGRVKLGVACLEAQRRSIGVSVQYANERIQFKQPISQFGAIKEKLARMAMSCYAGESAAYRVAHDIKQRIANFVEAGISHQEAELKGVEDFAIECSLLKVGASEDIQNCADDGIQIFGGMGFSAETPMESAWRDARIGRIYEGTNEINRMLAVGMLLKKGLKGHLKLMEAIMTAATSLAQPFETTTNKQDALETAAQMIHQSKTLFLVLLGNAAQKYGNELEQHQQILLDLADVLIEVYFAESCLLRTQKNIQRSSAEEQVHPIAMTVLYTFDAVQLTARKLKEVIISMTENEEQQQLLQKLQEATQYATWPNVAALKTQIADHLIKANQYSL